MAGLLFAGARVALAALGGDILGLLLVQRLEGSGLTDVVVSLTLSVDRLFHNLVEEARVIILLRWTDRVGLAVDIALDDQLGGSRVHDESLDLSPLDVLLGGGQWLAGSNHDGVWNSSLGVELHNHDLLEKFLVLLWDGNFLLGGNWILTWVDLLLGNDGLEAPWVHVNLVLLALVDIDFPGELNEGPIGFHLINSRSFQTQHSSGEPRLYSVSVEGMGVPREGGSHSSRHNGEECEAKGCLHVDSFQQEGFLSNKIPRNGVSCFSSV